MALNSKRLGVVVLVVFLALLVGGAFLKVIISNTWSQQSVFPECEKVPLECSTDQSCRELLRSAGISESDVASVVIECSSGLCTGREPSCSGGMP